MPNILESFIYVALNIAFGLGAVWGYDNNSPYVFQIAMAGVAASVFMGVLLLLDDQFFRAVLVSMPKNPIPMWAEALAELGLLGLLIYVQVYWFIPIALLSWLGVARLFVTRRDNNK